MVYRQKQTFGCRAPVSGSGPPPLDDEKGGHHKCRPGLPFFLAHRRHPAPGRDCPADEIAGAAEVRHQRAVLRAGVHVMTAP